MSPYLFPSLSIFVFIIIFFGVTSKNISIHVGDAPCSRVNCCFDSVCCGPGTVWDGSQCSILEENECTVPDLTFDYADKCFAAICIEEQCCGTDTTLVTDPSRDDPACYCSALCEGDDSTCGPGKDVSENKPGKDGAKFQDAGTELDISNSDCVFIADNVTATQKKRAEKKAGDIQTFAGLKSWDDLISKLQQKDKPVRDIVIVGHGANGGVDTTVSKIDGESINIDQAMKIKNHLNESSKILIMSCSQADTEDNDYMQNLANKTMRSVVGNVKSTKFSTFKGDGEWLIFKPKL